MILVENLRDNIEKTIYSVKTILFSRDESIFEKIDFYNDQIYLEPFLFAAILNGNEDHLNRVLFYYKRNAGIKLNFNQLYIPSLGYFEIDSKYIKQDIFIKKNENSIKVYNVNEECIDFELTPIEYIYKNIEFLKVNDELLKSFFRNQEGVQVQVDFLDKDLHEKDFKEGLDIIKRHSLWYYKVLMLVLKKVVFFKGEPYCFSTIQAHNTIFFNIEKDANEIFFLEHLLHEGAHIIFNYLTFDSKQSLFKYDFNTLLKNIDGIENEHGDLYSRFHGLYTHYVISGNFYEYLERNIYEKDIRKMKELEARFCFDMKKYKMSLELFSNDVLLDEGRSFYNIFLSKFHEIKKRSSIDINKYNFDNQSYMFSFEKFCKINII